MLDVPALSPKWVATPEEIASSESVSIPCQSYEELVEKMKLLERGELQRPAEAINNHNQVIHDWFYKIDGKAHQRVAEVIEKYSSAATQINRDTLRAMNAWSEEETGEDKKTPSALSRLLGRSKAEYKEARTLVVQRWDNSEKRYRPEDVQAIAAAIAQGNRTFSTPFKIQQAQQDADYEFAVSEGRTVRVAQADA
jgi:hypothetical protein